MILAPTHPDVPWWLAETLTARFGREWPTDYARRLRGVPPTGEAETNRGYWIMKKYPGLK